MSTSRFCVVIRCAGRTCSTPVEFGDDRFELLAELRDVVGDDLAEDGCIDVEIGVSEDHSCSDEVSPRHLWMRILEFVGQFRRGFTDDLDPTLRCCLQNWVALQSLGSGDVLEERGRTSRTCRGAGRDQASKVDGVGEDALGNAGTQTGLRRHVDVAAQQILQIHQQAAETEESAVVIEIDKEVDVAAFG